jgi:two-component system, LytTR family, response regulator
MTLRVLIVDDEPFARAGVRYLLEREPDVEIVGEVGDGMEAVTAILETSPDLVFLDVQMPELDGFGVVETVGVEKMPTVVFVTAFDEHALRAFDVHALDYVLKPIDPDRFALAIERARPRRGEDSTLGEKLAALVAEMRPAPEYLDRLVVRSPGRIYFVEVSEIDWIEAAENYVQLHANRQSHLVHGTISALERRLDPRLFLRVHRSTIVNLARIKEINPLFHGDYRIVLADGIEVTSGRTYRQAIRRITENQF